jgi:hypothetical protein
MVPDFAGGYGDQDKESYVRVRALAQRMSARNENKPIEKIGKN